MCKRASNFEKPTALDKAIGVDNFLIAEGLLCPWCKDLDCAGRAGKDECQTAQNIV